MPLKTCKPMPTSSCDKHKYNSSPTEMVIARKMPKKVIISKKWHPSCSHEVKSKSAGFIDSTERKKNNKTSNSLPAVLKRSKNLDFCKSCGDTDDIETAVAMFPNTLTRSNSETSHLSSKNINKALSTENSQQESKTKSQEVKVETKVVKQFYKNEKYNSKSTIDYAKPSSKCVKINSKNNKKALKNNKKELENEHEVIQEHFLNEKFADLYDSMHDFDAIVRSGQVLDTITEVPEKQASSNSKSSLSKKNSSSHSNVSIFPTFDDEASLKRLKEFREKNYFECHSSKNRLETKGSVISLPDHKCRYRLYLNDRLFPVAIDDDYNDDIRCVECHLPLDQAKTEEVNGTIQAKVKLGSETQDMVLLLPIKEPLIIKQKLKENNDNDDDVVYFGLVKMDQNGNSMFSPSLPSDSLALRYQKGYRQFNDVQSYRYDKIEDADVIYV